jgi:hypothetical protein
MLKIANEKNLVESVLNSLFWKKYAIIVRMIKPLVRVLWMVDIDDRPLMEYLYGVIYCAKKKMLRKF